MNAWMKKNIEINNRMHEMVVEMAPIGASASRFIFAFLFFASLKIASVQTKNERSKHNKKYRKKIVEKKKERRDSKMIDG